MLTRACVGALSRDDMAIMLKQLAGSSLSDDDLQVRMAAGSGPGPCGGLLLGE